MDRDEAMERQIDGFNRRVSQMHNYTIEKFLRRAESKIAQGKGLPFKASFGMLVIEWMRKKLIEEEVK